MSIFGLGFSLGAGGGPQPLALPTMVAAFFVADFDKKIMKIAPDGTSSIFHTYTGTEEPAGLAVDSANGRLYCFVGDSTAPRQIDIFTDLDEAVSAGPTTTQAITSGWGGQGFFDYVTGKVYWTGGSGGYQRADADALNDTSLYSTNISIDVFYWPPDDKLYMAETSSTDTIFGGNIDGTSMAQIGASSGGFNAGITVPSALAMNGTNYLLFTDRSSNTIRRCTRTGGGSDDITWLDLGAASTIKLFPTCIRIDYASDTLYFIGHDNAGTGVYGLYKIPLQEAAQSEGNIVLVKDLSADFTTTGPTNKHGLAIRFSDDESVLMVDA